MLVSLPFFKLALNKIKIDTLYFLNTCSWSYRRQFIGACYSEDDMFNFIIFQIVTTCTIQSIPTFSLIKYCFIQKYVTLWKWSGLQTHLLNLKKALNQKYSSVNSVPCELNREDPNHHSASGTQQGLIANCNWHGLQIPLSDKKQKMRKLDPISLLF